MRVQSTKQAKDEEEQELLKTFLKTRTVTNLHVNEDTFGFRSPNLVIV